MQEKIYTIPVNEAFDQTEKCPFCVLESKLENTEIDLITGASMMEPDIRIKTNEQGFCRKHFDKMYSTSRKLSLALTLQSHIEKLKDEVTPGGLFVKNNEGKPISRIEKLENDCYVCKRIESNFVKMLETACLLFESESEFRAKFNSQTCFCLPHYKRLLETSKKVCSKSYHSELVKDSGEIIKKYMDSLYEDISLFCKKFDYNYKDVPWGNSKTAVERAIGFLTSEDIK